jgi:UDP-GlcNAc:undecaprenyl-phosphate GlcNAc-1-phosphate transferase
MLVGIMLSAAATTATTSVDPQQLGGALGSLPLLLPLLIPVAVLAIPFVDLLLAIIRRVHRGQSPFAPDKQHLHHRLLQLGHSHRRAVLLLYFWSALLAFGGVAFAVWKRPWVLVVGLSAGVIFGVLVSAIPRLNSRRRATSVGRPAA